MRISDWSSDVCSSDLLPGMVYAVVARPPVVGGKLRSVRSDKALQVPGVLKVMEIPSYSGAPAFQALGGVAVVASNTRSEERRVGKECVSTCRSRWSPDNSKKKHKTKTIQHHK